MNKIVIILIDTGITHNFINFQVAKEVKATLTLATLLIKNMANRHKVLSILKCANFHWTMRGEPY